MKMIKYLHKSILVLVIASIGATGCKKFLDTNDNPNLASTAEVDLLLPAVQAAIGHALGSPLQIHGGIWAQFWTQSPKASQYKALDQYSITTTSFDRPWRMVYADALQDIQEIMVLTEGKSSFNQYRGIALVMKAFDMQMATDAWGDIPLVEAAQEGETNPAYNSQEQVYDSVFSYLNQALALLDKTATLTNGDADLIFKGDMDNWVRFANTLKLRAYLRLSEVAPQKAAAGIATLNGAEFLEQDAEIEYSTIGGNQNPLFSEILGLGRTQNLVASETSTDFLKNTNDPRLNAFYQEYEGTGIIGIPQGTFDDNADDFSIPTPALGASGQENASAQAPVKFISEAESYFLQAEAVTRGWLTSTMTAQQLFTAGITASFEAYDVEGLGTYLATSPAAVWPAGMEAQIEAIITQKWVAMNGNQSFEAWTEWRRTGYPDFFVTSAASELTGDEMPQRLLYPSSEVTRNVNFPGLKLITDRVWWDVD